MIDAAEGAINEEQVCREAHALYQRLKKRRRLGVKSAPLVCIVCNKAFVSGSKGRGRAPKTCSEKCKRQRLVLLEKIRRAPKVCVRCKKEWLGVGNKYCPKCRDSEGRPLRTCSECGGKFGAEGKALTCSPKCSQIRRKRRTRERSAIGEKTWRQSGRSIKDIRMVGNVAEAMFDLMCSVRGWQNAEVKEACNTAKFDRVIERGNGWETVQVKGMGAKGGLSAVQLKGGVKRYEPGDFDLLAVLDTSTGAAWLIPLGAVQTIWWRPVAKWDEYKTHISATEGGA